jgi:hypothetical protein
VNDGAVNNSIDNDLAALRERFPTWQIWYVPHAVDGSLTWCANPRAKQDDRRNVLHADSPGHLADYIAEAQA